MFGNILENEHTQWWKPIRLPPINLWNAPRLQTKQETNTMCSGVYESELKDDFATDYEKDSKRKPMGDIKFMTAADFISEQKEDDNKYVYPGGDCQV